MPADRSPAMTPQAAVARHLQWLELAVAAARDEEVRRQGRLDRATSKNRDKRTARLAEVRAEVAELSALVKGLTGLGARPLSASTAAQRAVAAKGAATKSAPTKAARAKRPAPKRARGTSSAPKTASVPATTASPGTTTRRPVTSKPAGASARKSTARKSTARASTGPRRTTSTTDTTPSA